MTEAAEKRKKDVRALLDRQKVLERRLAEIDGKTEKRNHYLRTLMKCKKGIPMTAEVLHALIDKIEVFKDMTLFAREQPISSTRSAMEKPTLFRLPGANISGTRMRRISSFL